MRRISRFVGGPCLVALTLLPTQALAAEYTFGRGDGEKTLRTGGCDDDGRPYGDPNAVLVMRDLNVSQVSVVVTGFNIALHIVGTGDTVSTAFYYRHADGNCFEGLRELRFADGTIWRGTLRPSDAADTVTGTSADEVLGSAGGDDVVLGAAGADALDGGDGDDELDGGVGNDTLHGALGSDLVYGYDGNDVLDGGLGDDDLYGERGSDTYVFSGDFGYDYVEDYDRAYGSDVVRFEQVRSNAVSWSRSGNHLVISVTGSANRVKILDYFYSQAYRIEQIQFADGVTLRYADVASRVR